MTGCSWKKFRNIFLYGALLLVFGCSGREHNPFTTENFGRFSSDVINKLPRDIVSDANTVFLYRGNIITLLAASGASAVMHNTDADENIAGNLERHRSFKDNWSNEGLSVAGGAGAHFTAAALWYMTSLAYEDENNQQRAWLMLRALSVTNLSAIGLKVAVDNERPNGDRWAWPSSHTASSFTVASVLDEFYGHKIGIPAYGFASVVAWRMMDAKDHWASDVVFGAALGWVVGHSIAGNNRLPEIAGFKIRPATVISNSPVAGINLVRQF